MALLNNRRIIQDSGLPYLRHVYKVISHATVRSGLMVVLLFQGKGILMSTRESGHENTSADSSSDNFHIVVLTAAQDPEQLADRLMDLPGMDRATAKLQSRLMPGIIPYAYEEQCAIAVAASISELGSRACAVAAANIPDLIHAHQTHHVKIHDSSLEAIDTSDQSQMCQWDQISVISVGVLSSNSPSRFRAAPTIANGSSHKIWNEGARVGGKQRPEALLVLSDGQTAISMASDEMNYEDLGDRITTASAANFRLLLQEIVAHANSAWLTPSTLAFLEQASALRTNFRSHDEFRRYTEFQTVARFCMNAERLDDQG